MSSSREKILPREELAPRVAQWRAEGKRVGLTNGVFDLLHAGHVEYLEAARAICDILIVSINTDASARELKGQGRPFNSLDDRALTLAALACVDWVTFHPEQRMRETLELLRPTYYIKGGDYSPERLTSRDVVERYGGEARILPLRPGISTTEIVERILAVRAAPPARYVERAAPAAPRPAVFLDRDGTLNEEVYYLRAASEIRMIAGAGSALAALRAAGFLIVSVTNQAGIGMGYITEKEFLRCNSELCRQMAAEGGAIDRFYYSPYSIAENSPCRKPGTGMIDLAVEEMRIDRARSWIVGDRASDIECGRRAGLRTVLVETGSLRSGDPCDPEPDFRCPSIREAAGIILANHSAASVNQPAGA